MRTDEAAITFPCGADWSAMTRIDDQARLCGACDTVVTDLSAMREDDARRALASRSGRMCVRYLYDPRTGEIAFGGAAPIPVSRLAQRAKQAAAAAATLLAPMLVQACGGASGSYDDGPSRHDPFAAGDRVNADPNVSTDRPDASADARIDGDARPHDAAQDASSLPDQDSGID